MTEVAAYIITTMIVNTTANIRTIAASAMRLPLPSTVDAEKIEASYEDGVLEVSLPKAAEVKPKKIPVSTKKKEKASK